MTKEDTLKAYRQRRNFRGAPQPSGGRYKSRKRPRFAVRKHGARTLQCGFRLEGGGVLKSWAVPKGPSMNPRDKRLAVRTEDHPLEYAGFERVIPASEYGARTELAWDAGMCHFAEHMYAQPVAAAAQGPPAAIQRDKPQAVPALTSSPSPIQNRFVRGTFRGNDMEPRIQYAKTADGVSIAFWTLGKGKPFLSLPIFPTHVELECQVPELHRLYERIVEKRMLVRYDGRGSGLSDRDVTDYSLDASVLDLEAVIDHLGLERFAVYGALHAGPIAIAYAARHLERVSHLVLWCSYARASDWLQSPQVQALRALLDKDWEVYTETVAHVAIGWSAGEEARVYAAFMRKCTTQKAAQAAFRAINDYDVMALLSQLKVATLVFHRRQVPFPDVSLARHLTSRIPDARLVLLEGTSPAPHLGDTETAHRVIDEFLDEGEEAAARVAAPVAADVRTILFTDMESSSALRQRLGDAKAQDLVRTHNSIVRNALKAHGGSEIKHTGDGIMASFPTASGALECAVAIQRGIAAHVEQHPDAPLGVYIGLNAGEPIAEEKDLFGTSVDLARRICDNAEPGQILVSDVVRQLATGKGFLFSDRGDVVLRGFEEPVRLYEVKWQED